MFSLTSIQEIVPFVEILAMVSFPLFSSFKMGDKQQGQNIV
jgi:hypothetical protein